MKTIIHTVTLEVETPYKFKNVSVENAINTALDEPPWDWQDWSVGYAAVTNAVIVEHDVH